MKIRTLTLTLLLVVITVLSAGAMETKFSMELWNRYTAKMEDGAIDASEFALKRGYFRLEPTFGDNIKGRFNLDFFSDDVLDGVGMKLKYAYVDFSKIFIPEAKFTFGLMKNYFGTLYDWDYTSIQKDPSDLNKICSSTDYGMGIYGYIPGGYGEYAVQIVNGEGYKKTAGDIDVNPTAIANIRFIPIPGITLGGSVYYAKKGLLNADELNDTTLSDTATMAYAGVAKVAFGPFYMWGEYIAKNIDSDNAMGYMVMPVIQLGKIMPADIDIIARYDFWDGNTDGAIIDDSYQKIMAGFNYNLMRDSKHKPQLWLQTNYERTMYEDTAKDPVDAVMVQLRWKFSHTFN